MMAASASSSPARKATGDRIRRGDRASYLCPDAANDPIYLEEPEPEFLRSL